MYNKLPFILGIILSLFLTSFKLSAQCSTPPLISWSGGNQSGTCGGLMPDFTGSGFLSVDDTCTTSGTPAIPAHSSVFTGSVRGYYFTAPVSFVMTSVYVPTEASGGNQSIAVVRFNNNMTPPLYSTTTDSFATLFLTQNDPTVGSIPVNITIHAGEVIGLLAQRATSNSYAPGNYVSSIAGQSVTLSRLGMQYPLTTTAPQQLWTEASGSISRVQFTYTTLSLSVTQEPAAGSTLTVGANPVTLKVKDIDGDSATTTFNVSVTPVGTPNINISTPATANDSLSVCAGTLVTLSCPDVGVNEYLWLKNGVAVNYQVGGAGTYTVQTIGSGTDIYQLVVVYGACLSDTSATMTVIKNTPTTTITPSGPTVYCVSNPTTLNAVGGYDNYLWKRSTTTVQNGASSAYTPTASGNHNVTITDTYGCTKTSAWTNLTINPLPTANAGVDRSICSGTSVQIGGPAAAGNTYAWTPSGSLSNANISNPMASPLSNTTYTLTVTKTSTGCTNTDAVNVNISSGPPIPSISSSTTPVCEGGSISIAPTSIGANSINWYKNGVLLYNKPTNYVQIVTTPSVASDAYTIASKGANGCLSGYSNVINAWVKEAAMPTITSNPAAVGGVATVCVPGGTSGNAILLANTTTPSPTYSWKLAGSFIAGANQNSYLSTVTTSQNNKVYSVQATYPNACVRTSSNLTVTLVTSGCTPRLGSDKEDANTLINDALSVGLYPNPTTNILTVEVSNSLDSEGKILLYNTLGQVVLEKSVILSEGKLSETLNISHLAAGVYSLSFQTATQSKVQKVVKE